MAADKKSWRNQILHDLQDRNKRQCDLFAPLIKSHNRLLETSDTYRMVNGRMHAEIEKLKVENADLQLRASSGAGGGGGGGSGSGGNERILQERIFKLQEELTELHRRKGENAQQLIDLSNSVKDKDKQSAVSDAKIKELESRVKDLDKECKRLNQVMDDDSLAKQCLTDELQALQMAYTSLENAFRRLQEENTELVSRWMALKADAANKMNAENDDFRKRKQDEIQTQLAQAAAAITIDCTRKSSLGENEPACVVSFMVTVPTRALQTVEAHDGEVNAIRWSPSGRLFATGGSDRKLKLWELRGGKCEPKGVLVGSNAGIMSVDFDTEENHALGASSDFACRVWTCSDLRPRHTLTGHSGKVLAAKFLSDNSRVISGSHDRTMKLWDLRNIACIKTYFAGSSCNDIVVFNGSHVISGHFDKTIRFWDTRADTGKAHKDITLDGKVASLDLSSDKSYLLGCSRDDAITIFDMKMTQKLATLTAEGFHVATDWTRAVFSPDGSYVAAGSSDGGVYVWEVATQKLHSTLREHKEAVIACAWNPNGKSLLSCDKHKTFVYWSDF